MSNRIEFVYFDLGNVLVRFDPDLACANVARRFGVTVEAAEKAIHGSGLQSRFERGEITGTQYAEFVLQHLDRVSAGLSRPSTAQLLDAVSEMFFPIESMRDTLSEVRRGGARVGVLSNTCSAHWEWILRQSYAVLEGEFAATILSYEVASMKPDALIYQAAETAANLPGARILFLDDKRENVDAARRRGWQAEQCFGGEQAESALQLHGVIGDRKGRSGE